MTIIPLGSVKIEILRAPKTINSFALLAKYCKYADSSAAEPNISTVFPPMNGYEFRIWHADGASPPDFLLNVLHDIANGEATDAVVRKATDAVVRKVTETSELPKSNRVMLKFCMSGAGKPSITSGYSNIELKHLLAQIGGKYDLVMDVKFEERSPGSRMYSCVLLPAGLRLYARVQKDGHYRGYKCTGEYAIAKELQSYMLPRTEAIKPIGCGRREITAAVDKYKFMSGMNLDQLHQMAAAMQSYTCTRFATTSQIFKDIVLDEEAMSITATIPANITDCQISASLQGLAKHAQC